jgi:hypothetical protein
VREEAANTKKIVVLLRKTFLLQILHQKLSFFFLFHTSMIENTFLSKRQEEKKNIYFFSFAKKVLFSFAKRGKRRKKSLSFFLSGQGKEEPKEKRKPRKNNENKRNEKRGKKFREFFHNIGMQSFREGGKGEKQNILPLPSQLPLATPNMQVSGINEYTFHPFRQI